MTRFVPVADHGLLVEIANDISDAASQAVLALDHAIAAASIHGVTEVVPAFVNLLVMFDPLVTDHGALQHDIEQLLPAPSLEHKQTTQHEIAVCYDNGLGLDLEAVAAQCDISIDAVIGLHLAGDYRVAMFGFAPGYAYMSGVPPALQVPRKTTPVAGVDAQSVIIAGPQCLITTLEMPTGWSILGKSPTNVLLSDAGDGVPVRFAVGDLVRFTRVDFATYERLLAEP